MNFYKRYPGDYLRDTSHLSLAEHGAYSLMLDYHYSTEKPLPKGRHLYRLLRAEKASERRIIDSVLSEFWVEKENGFVHKRALKEFEKMERKRSTARENGALGGRPENQDRNQTETNVGSSSVIFEKQYQTPDTRHQTKKTIPPRAPTREAVLGRLIRKGIPNPDPIAEKFFNHFEAIGWVDHVGRPIARWESRLDNWIIEEADRAKRKQPAGQRSESASERTARIAREMLKGASGGDLGELEEQGSGSRGAGLSESVGLDAGVFPFDT